MKTIPRLHILAALAVLGFGSPVVQAEDDDRQQMGEIAQGLGLITLEEARAKALAAKPGVVTDAELEDRDWGKGWDYEFEVADADGHEWDVHVDAKSGKVRKVSREWF